MMLKKKKIRKILKLMMNIKLEMKIILKKEEKVIIKIKMLKLIQVMNIWEIQD